VLESCAGLLSSSAAQEAGGGALDVNAVRAGACGGAPDEIAVAAQAIDITFWLLSNSPSVQDDRQS